MALHHATVIAERWVGWWVGEGEGRRGEAQPLAGAVALTLALFCSSNHTPARALPVKHNAAEQKDLSHIPNTCLGLN